MELDLGDAFKKPRKERQPRREHDAYMTLSPLVTAIVDRAMEAWIADGPKPFADPQRILEPSCGDGEFIRACLKKWPNAQVVGVDIRDEVRSTPAFSSTARFWSGDFLTFPLEMIAAFDLIIGNPPYSIYREFIAHALEGMRDGTFLAFLLPYGKLVGSLEAQAWWKTPLANGLTPARQIVVTPPICPRPSFTGQGTAATEYMLLVMRKGFDNGGRYDPIEWEKPAPRRGRPKKPVEAAAPVDPNDVFANL